MVVYVVVYCIGMLVLMVGVLFIVFGFESSGIMCSLVWMWGYVVMVVMVLIGMIMVLVVIELE